MEHSIDKNRGLVGNHLLQQSTSHTKKHQAVILRVDPKGYLVDVELLDTPGTDGRPAVVHNVRVARQKKGEHCLPEIGEQVNLEFENGVATSGSRATVKDRYYSEANKPPTHPLLEDDNYHGGRFQQNAGGGFEFEHPDGQKTVYHAQPVNQEGAKSNTRATGVAKSAVEGRMDKASAKMGEAKTRLKRVADTSKILGDTQRQLVALTDLAAYAAQNRGS